MSPAEEPFRAMQIWALGCLSEVARWNEISAGLLLCETSNADFPLTSRAEASPCPKAYLFLTGRCSLASLVKPQTVDQICSQAHCADEGLLERGWASHRADKTSFVVPPLLASLHPLFFFFFPSPPAPGQPSVRKNNFSMISLNTTKGKEKGFL